MTFLRSLVIPILWVICLKGIAQTNRYAVWFNSKSGTPYSIAAPKAFLSDRSIARRGRQSIAITEADLPVNPAFKEAVRATGTRLLYTSRWMNCALVEATESQMVSVAGLSFVGRTELVAPGAIPVGQSSDIPTDQTSARTSGNALTQLVQMGVDQLHADGWNGTGVLVGVFDSGFPGVPQGTGFAQMRPRIRDTYNFPWNRRDVYGYDEHGADVLSIIAGDLPEGYTGSAPGADFLLYVTEYAPSEYRIEEFNWLFAAERADSAGVDVINTSLGYSTFDDPAMSYTYGEMTGSVALISRAAEMAAARGIVVVVSAGNEGNGSWRHITAPADAAGVLSVGSVNETGQVSGFSSRGPTADGRIKPDVSALGSNTTYLANGEVTATGSGTSFSAPLITGLVAGIIQSRPDLSSDEIISLVRSSGSNAGSPDNDIGYGIPDYNSIRLVVGVASDSELRIWPNPTAGNEFHLEWPADDYEIRDVVLVSASGQMIRPMFHQSASASRASIDVSGTAPGLYVLRTVCYKPGVGLSPIIKTFRLIRR